MTAGDLDAMRKANRVRLAQAEIRRQVRSGVMGVEDVLCARPYGSDSMTLFSVLKAQYRWGSTNSRSDRTSRFLEGVGISEVRRVRDLTERQVHVVCEALRPESGGAEVRGQGQSRAA
jgi:hypothetical protein